MLNKLKSRKFLMAIVAGFLIIANDGLGLNLDAETITAFTNIVIGWIAVEGVADVASVIKRKAE